MIKHYHFKYEKNALIVATHHNATWTLMMVFWKDNGNASKSTWNIEFGNQFSVSIALQQYNGYEINAQTYIQQMSKAIATTK